MADETPKIEQPLAQVPEVVAPAKKLEPVDEFAATIDSFFVGVQTMGLKSMKSMLTQLKEKADNVITKLDAGVGDDPPKKL